MSVEKQMLNLIQKVRDEERATCKKEIDDELVRLFNLDWENQSEKATERRKVIQECRFGILYLGDKQTDQDRMDVFERRVSGYQL